jgi:hypothetical protein
MELQLKWGIFKIQVNLLKVFFYLRDSLVIHIYSQAHLVKYITTLTIIIIMY